jgi:hypothetical protein
MASQQPQASFGRTWRITRKLAGTGRDELKLLEGIFTKRLRVSATGWAVCRRRQIHFFITWQVFRQRLARRTLTWRPIDRRHLAFGVGVVGLQVFKLQVKLFDLMVELLGLAVELHAPQLRDSQFQMLDLGSTRVQLRLQFHGLFVARQQQCLQGIDIVGNWVAVNMG